MDKNFTHNEIFKNTECPSDALLLAYVNNTIGDKEKRLVELHLVDCEMCNDMVEGFQQMKPEHISEIKNEIEEKIDHKVALFHKNTKTTFKWYYAAAAVLIVGLTGILYNLYFSNLEANKVADIPESKQIEVPANTDSNVNTILDEEEDSAGAMPVKTTIQAVPVVAEESNQTRVQVEDISGEVAATEYLETPALNQKSESEINEQKAAAEPSTKSLNTVSTGNTVNLDANTSFNNYSYTLSPGVVNTGNSPAYTAPNSNNDLKNLSMVETIKHKEHTKKSSKKSIEKAKSDQPAKSESGALTFEESAPEEAAMAKDEMADNDFSDFQAAQLLLSQKKYPEALVKFNSFLKSNPKYCEALKGAAQCYENTNNIKEAIINLTTITKLKCGKASDAAYLKLGELYQKNNQTDEAKKVLEIALKSSFLDIAEQAKKELDKLK